MIMDDEKLDVLIGEWYESANPLQQLAADIAIQVSAGEIPYGEPLPPGEDLAPRESLMPAVAGNTALDILANAETGLIRREKDRYVSTVQETGRKRPDPRQIILWSKGGPVEKVMAELADRIVAGKIRPGQRLPSDDEIIMDWLNQISGEAARRAKRRLSRYRDLVVFREEKFFAAGEAS
jgi:DNA-binding transcriptional regulator YhcF (GntR family)